MKGYLKIFYIMFLVLPVAVGCFGEKNDDSKSGSETAAPKTSQALPIFRSVSPQEAKFMLSNRKDLLLIDVREEHELREGYIAGSQLIPMSDLTRGSASMPTGQPLLLVCAVGGRSYGIGQYYYQKGYQEIYSLSGGISAWKRAGLPLQYK